MRNLTYANLKIFSLTKPKQRIQYKSTFYLFAVKRQSDTFLRKLYLTEFIKNKKRPRPVSGLRLFN